jgi:hypothetical protein
MFYLGDNGVITDKYDIELGSNPIAATNHFSQELTASTMQIPIITKK